jgi:Uma2 family endonuclease
MSAITHPVKPVQTCYPDSDGEPMADNTLQFEWISTIKWGLEALFADRSDVFVAGDHLVYPVDDENTPGVAPDVYVAFGRPKGHRGSYKVWEEGGVFPPVIFEVWSPGNRFERMQEKFRFYEQHGAEEYYIVYPEPPAFAEGWCREGGRLEGVPDIKTWVSPRLGIRFELHRGQLNILRPDGTRFLTYVEIDRQLAEERRRAEKLAAKLRELGIDPDAV